MMMNWPDILGYTIAGFGAVAIAASPLELAAGNVSAVSPRTEASPRTETSEKVLGEKSIPIIRRHRITLNVTSLEDVKVQEGDQVESGQFLSDRTEQRLKLEAQRDRLKGAIAQMSQPLTPIAALPEPDFSKELLTIEEAKLKLNQLQNVPLPDFRAKGEFRQTLDFNVIEQKATLEQQKLQAEIDLQKAIADLAEAKNAYQYQQYEHSLKMQQYQSNIQRQQYQIGELLAQLQKVEDDLERIAGVRSPASGRVRRVKVLGQSDRNIQIEVLIDPREKPSETP